MVFLLGASLNINNSNFYHLEVPGYSHGYLAGFLLQSYRMGGHFLAPFLGKTKTC
jgi:hypothetical protein